MKYTPFKYFILSLFLLLPACSWLSGLSQEEVQKLQQLRQEITMAVNQELAEIVKLTEEHKAGKLTTMEFARRVMELKNNTKAIVTKAYTEIDAIYKAARERKIEWWKAILMMALGMFGWPSRGAHRWVATLAKKFKKKEQPA